MVRSSFSPAPGTETKEKGALLPRVGRSAHGRPPPVAPSDYSEYVQSRAVLVGYPAPAGRAATPAPRRPRRG